MKKRIPKTVKNEVEIAKKEPVEKLEPKDEPPPPFFSGGKSPIRTLNFPSQSIIDVATREGQTRGTVHETLYDEFHALSEAKKSIYEAFRLSRFGPKTVTNRYTFWMELNKSQELINKAITAATHLSLIHI